MLFIRLAQQQELGAHHGKFPVINRHSLPEQENVRSLGDGRKGSDVAFLVDMNKEISIRRSEPADESSQKARILMGKNQVGNLHGQCFTLVRRACLWLFLAMFAGVPAFGQTPWTGILATSRAIDWKNAGLPATFPDGETTANPWTPPTRPACASAHHNVNRPRILLEFDAPYNGHRYRFDSHRKV